MKFIITRKKTASFKEIGYETIEFNHIKTVKDFLTQMTIHEYHQQHTSQKPEVLSTDSIVQQASLGKVTFNEKYNNQKDELSKAIERMLLDFYDGLFKVFINQKEYTDLNEEIDLLEENEVVLIQLVMMAGRLW